MTQTTERPELAELDALYREGLLTEDEHSEAQRRVQARITSVAVPRVPRHAAPEVEFPPLRRQRAARSGGRHAKATSPRWPWFVLAALIAIAGSAVGVALARHPKPHGSAQSNGAASRLTTQAPAIIGGSRVNSPVSVNLGGANADIVVSSLTTVPVTAHARKSPDVSYRSTVTAVGVTGAFMLTPTEFTAQTSDGRTFKTARGSFPAVRVTVGHEQAGQIVFTLPKSEKVTAILFTSALGEQLSVWSTS